jgi:hypothetical protein
MRILNPQVLSQLKEVPKEYSWARLTPEDTSIQPYVFLVNPSTLEFNGGANYGENPTLGTNVQRQQYFNSTGWTLKIPELLLVSACHDRDMQPLIDGLKALTRCNPDKQQWYTPVVSFTWGKRSISNLVVTTLGVTEIGWRSGLPVRAIVNGLTLLEVPPKTATTSRSTSQSTKALTERQQSDGSKAGQDWLKSNLNKLTPSTAAIVRAGKYLMDTKPDGVVTMLDTSRQVLGVVGTWDGTKLDTSKGTLSN